MSLFKAAEGINLEETAQRTDILHFMDVTAKAENQGSEVYHQLGAGWMVMTESPSAQTKERKFINEKSARKSIARYAPTFAFETMLMFNDPAVRLVYDIYTQRKTGSSTVVTMITVDKFDKAVSEYYPARKGKYAVEVSSCDDDDDMIIKGNFNGQGDEAIGWFNPSDGTWSDTEPGTTSGTDTTSGTETGTDDSGTDAEQTEGEDENGDTTT